MMIVTHVIRRVLYVTVILGGSSSYTRDPEQLAGGAPCSFSPSLLEFTSRRCCFLHRRQFAYRLHPSGKLWASITEITEAAFCRDVERHR